MAGSPEGQTYNHECTVHLSECLTFRYSVFIIGPTSRLVRPSSTNQLVCFAILAKEAFVEENGRFSLGILKSGAHLIRKARDLKRA
jgi:hypothetical protein